MGLSDSLYFVPQKARQANIIKKFVNVKQYVNLCEFIFGNSYGRFKYTGYCEYMKNPDKLNIMYDNTTLVDTKVNPNAMNPIINTP